ncbi:VOC family protein [uncultured Draconibacterium sp.]|uniref:VOC family protein n=1 Tax=uncultured Draconibacterium sp. TaxID=1573823 RepID=UPI0029C839E8|nr:VOC family protein [uncultured Draconibacterium sp.]
MEFNCIRLLVIDFDKCFRFYSETLGLKVSWGEIGGNFASFDIGLPFGISIFKTDLMAEVIGNSEKSLPIDSREKIVIILKVKDVDASFQKLIKKGVKFINKPTDMSGWGLRVAHFRDPEENLIEIWSELNKDKWDQVLEIE